MMEMDGRLLELSVYYRTAIIEAMVCSIIPACADMCVVERSDGCE